MATNNLILPEFSPTRHIDFPFNCIVTDHSAAHDIILGNDFLQTVGIDCLGSTQQIQWMGIELPYRAPEELGTEGHISKAFLDSVSASTDPYDNTCFVSSLLESKNEKVDTKAVAHSQKHLTIQQQHDLANLLSNFPIRMLSLQKGPS